MSQDSKEDEYGWEPSPAGTLFMPGELASSVVIKQAALIVVDDRGTVVRFSELLAAWRAQQERETKT